MTVSATDVSSVSVLLPDSDKEEPSTADLVVAPKQMSSALGSLLANYGSMSESDEEPEGILIGFFQTNTRRCLPVVSLCLTKSLLS